MAAEIPKVELSDIQNRTLALICFHSDGGWQMAATALDCSLEELQDSLNILSSLGFISPNGMSPTRQ